MSQSIPIAFVKQFSANVFHLSQQKGSRLRGFVRTESQKAETASYDRIGSTTAQKKVGRHSDTTYQDTPNSRRTVAMEDFFQADLVDKEDKIRLIMNPESEYTQSFSMSMGRAIDDVIIAAGLGTTQGGKEGETAIVLPDAQKVAATNSEDASPSTTGTPLNVETLRRIKRKFDEDEVGDDQRYISVPASQIDALLGRIEVTSQDFASVKALVNGDVNSFMGFRFIRSERLPLTSAATTYDGATGEVSTGSDTIAAGAVRCMAWQKMGILLAVGKDVNGRIDQLPTKHYSTQVYMSMTFGGTRMEEEKVIEVICTID